MDPSVLSNKPLNELKSLAAELDMRGYQRMRKADLVDAIVRVANGQDPPEAASGDSGTTDASENDDFEGDASVSDDETPVRSRVRTRTRERGEDEGTSDGESAGHGGAEERQEQSGTGDGAGTQAEDAAEQSKRDAAEETKRDAAEESKRDAAEETKREDERGQQGQQDQGDEERGQRAHQDQDQERGEGEQDRQGQGGQGQQGQGQQGQGQQGQQGQGQQGQGQQGQQGQSRQGQGGQGQGQQGQQDQGGQGGGGDGARRRRSRRDRRRGKGGGGGGGPQGGGGGGSQQGQKPRQQEEQQPQQAEPGEVRAGVLDILPEGYGFLRTTDYLAGDQDVYVSQSQARRHGLRRGDVVEGPIRAQKSGDKFPGLHHVEKVNGVKPDENGQLPHRPDFKDMTPLFPSERLGLETPDGPISMRIIDLMSPIGKGQRGLIVSPPKAGKTTVLKELGQAIAYNNPECHVMVVLVDERPEEVTDMQRSVPGEIVASTFDRPADDHTQISELAMERAKRLVEQGSDVVILLDSITRLARAYNLAAPASGRIMSGGVDSSALYPPKRFFGAARNIEGGGSMTIVATALIETGSKMDEVIFEEFKGTGNMELRLDRRLEQKRVFPAIDIQASGTRKEELLLDKEELEIIWKLRRVLHALEGPAALELLIDKMKQTRSNNQFLVQIQKSNLQA